ncbi:hypothetical protein [Corallococcus macrosporus]|uniref:Uncharacterized protein n=1 Tax=Myxococcus fulvus (strain ATCC BAA-855 / HW-1) TaxID=483219 RepID=F8CIF7_MYXFH|nr:hypothetical protein [Corallococcus macrosporus]AEI65023.1 hypothetical protein LILAB_15600 [Corallococcus macrosporus]
MNKHLAYAAYGWLSFTGVMHFVIDVVSQHLRGKHGPSTNPLYHGVHTALALGQLVYGVPGAPDNAPEDSPIRAQWALSPPGELRR